LSSSARFAVLAAAALGLNAASIPSSTLAQQPAAAVPPAMAAMPDFRQIVQSAKEKVFPSVVYIRVISEVTSQGRKESQASSGSGAIISAEGHVLTNWHVVDKATNVRCLLSDGRHYDAKVLGSDKDVDLAVIKLDLKEGDKVPVAEIGDSTQLKEGDFVMAMGAPWD
jgi:serine protease Do